LISIKPLMRVIGIDCQAASTRSRHERSAYARLWLADRRFQWAGLAAFASKQVGCSLLHSADIIDAHRREREQIERTLGQGSAPGVQYGAA
jgi:hypothetical protein